MTPMTQIVDGRATPVEDRRCNRREGVAITRAMQSRRSFEISR